MNRFSRFFHALSGAFGILGIWECLHLVLKTEAVPEPFAVLVLFARLLPEGLSGHLAASILRVAAATMIQILVGSALGMVMGTVKRIDAFVDPVVRALFPVPKIAFLPVFMILFGLGDLSKILLVASVTVFQTIVSTRDGVRSIPRDTLLSARSLGLTGRMLFMDVIFPAIAPGVLTSVRLGVGTGIAVLFFAENYATRWGIGYYIMNQYAMADYPRTYAGIVAISLAGLGLFALIDRAERRFCPWTRIGKKPE